MKILVSSTHEANFRGRESAFVSEVSMFKSKKEFDDKVYSLKLPFYVIDLKERLEKDEFNALMHRLKITSVETILDEEATKMVKKKSGPNADLIKMIVQIG